MYYNEFSTRTASSEFWGHLKAMRFSLQKAMDMSSRITKLDRENLLALGEFLRDNCIRQDAENLFSVEFLSTSEFSRSRFVPDIDVEGLLRGSEEFKTFLDKSKTSAKHKVQRLISALNTHISKSSDELIPRELPPDEFKIMNIFLDTMITRIQPPRISELR